MVNRGRKWVARLVMYLALTALFVVMFAPAILQIGWRVVPLAMAVSAVVYVLATAMVWAIGVLSE